MINKKKHTVLTICAAFMIASITLITSFFTETEHRANSITIGEVGIEIQEDYNKQTVYPNEPVIKNPSVKNIGKNEAYVFLEVDIPKAEVTLLKDDGQLLDSSNPKSIQELFQMIAEKSGTENDANIKTVTGNDNFAYHDRWNFLISETEENYNTYVFVYTEKLGRRKETSVLFDKIQLKKFVDGEAAAQNAGDSVVKIDIRAYAIQADNLEGMTYTPGQDGFYQELYSIVKKRQAAA